MGRADTHRGAWRLPRPTSRPTVLAGLAAALLLSGCESCIGLDELEFVLDGAGGAGGAGGSGGSGGAGGDAGGCVAGGDPCWALRAGGVGADVPSAVTVDGAGNIILVGRAVGPLGLDCSEGADDVLAGQEHAFVVKLSPSGDCLWSRGWFASEANDSQLAPLDVALGPAGEIFVVGESTGSVTFGEDCALEPNEFNDPLDGFLVMLDSHGSCNWVQPLWGGGPQSGRSVAYFQPGNQAPVVLVVGDYEEELALGLAATPLEVPAIGVFLAAFPLSGTEPPSYGLAYGSDSNTTSQARAIAVGGGKAYLLGTFAGTLDFSDTSGGGGSVLNATGTDIFLARFNALEGKCEHSVRFGGDGDQHVGAAAVLGDANAPLWLTGHFDGTLDFGSGGSPPLDAGAAGNDDVFLARLELPASSLPGEPGAAPAWAAGWGSSGAQWAADLAVTDGSVTTVGWFEGELDFDPADPLQAADDGDVFVASFATDGSLRWSRSFPSAGPKPATAVAAHCAQDGRCYAVVVGSFTPQITIGDALLPSEGGTDIFVTKLLVW